MTRSTSRRSFLAGMSAVTVTTFLSARSGHTMLSSVANTPFKLSVITDELTQDLGRALEIASQEFGLRFVELRSVWDKNMIVLDEKEIAEVQRLLDRYGLQVSDIASPLFKTNWSGAPTSKYSPEKPQFGADFPFEKQDEVLERSVALAQALKTDRIRCFDFWRLDDPKPFRAAMDEKLRETSTRLAPKKLILLLENEFACNTATGAEATRTLRAVQLPNFQLNWDPGNAAYRGELAYPDGYQSIPKERIGHMHCKDVRREADGSFEWEAMGRGIIDYVGQFRALLKDRYHGTISLETHWRGGGSPEESTRVSMAGLKEQLKKAGAL